MIRECPICEVRSEAQPCICGYDFETGDRSKSARRALIVKQRSTKKAWLGVVMLMMIPMSAWLAYLRLPFVAMLFFFAVPTQLIVGLSWIWRGLSWRRAAQQRIDRSTRPAELPEARIVE